MQSEKASAESAEMKAVGDLIGERMFGPDDWPGIRDRDQAHIRKVRRKIERERRYGWIKFILVWGGLFGLSWAGVGAIVYGVVQFIHWTWG